MLRSILLVLDDTDGAAAARDHAFALARATGAALTGAVVLDRPHTAQATEPVPLGATAFAERRNTALAAQAEAEADAALAACAAAAGDLAVRLIRLADAPEPALRAAGATHDLIVIGRDSTLGRTEADAGLAPAIEALLHEGARPLLVVPPGAALNDAGPVLIAYNGSLPCQRALQLFALLGLARGAAVTVLTVQTDAADAARCVAEATGYLATWGIAATALPIAGSNAAELILAELATLRPRLLVMGAYRTTGLRALLLGTLTGRLLRTAPCPIFVHH